MGAGVQKSNILNIGDIRQLSLRLDNLRLKFCTAEAKFGLVELG